ncbi:MAG: ThiF family adenylyltransferase, partial [Lachnospiraceae bacterium]|nr:ThiF family adenylyltransferase [Lachnospiraceae bacterium]
MEAFSRTELLIGKEAMTRLSRSRVAIFGIGGVGGYVVEALIRSGVGALDLIDNDTVAVSNLNRQIIATTATIGQYKVDAARERCLSINPQAQIRTYSTFYLPETT